MKSMNAQDCTLPCTSVMGLLKETDRWIAYQCFTCRKISVALKGSPTKIEIQQAEREFDLYVTGVLTTDATYQSQVVRRMTPEQVENYLHWDR